MSCEGESIFGSPWTMPASWGDSYCSLKNKPDI